MLCPYSKIRENPITHKLMLTPCGKCVPCRIAYRIPWQYRLYHELKKWDYCGSFVTMTYSDDKYDINNGLNYQHIRTFFDELRKDGLKFKYFITGEYGELTARCHWHALLFGIPPQAKKLIFKRWQKWCYEPEFIVTPITQSRIRYTLKYLDKEAVSSDFEDLSTSHQFEFLLDSAKLMYNSRSFQRPRSYCSKNLGADNFFQRFPELYQNGNFRDGSVNHKPSKHQIDSLSRNDIFFQKRREKFRDESYSYAKLLAEYGSDDKIKEGLLNKSINFLSDFNIGELKNGKHIKTFNSSDFDILRENIRNNFLDDFQKEVSRVKKLRFRSSIASDLARLCVHNF